MAEEPIGSLAQETAKLLRAIAAERVKLVGDEGPASDHLNGSGPAHQHTGEHICTTGWCPICQVVGYLQDHPEMVEQVTETVTDAALQIGRALRDFLDKTMPDET
jgi:hypothetical protein